MKTTTETPFAIQLRVAIIRKISQLKQGGTVKMGLGNLRQVVQPPRETLEGAPKGANAPWLYAQLFSEVCQGPGIREYLLPEKPTGQIYQGTTSSN